MHDGLEIGVFRGLITEIKKYKEDLIFNVSPIECLKEALSFVLFKNSDLFPLILNRYLDSNIYNLKENAEIIRVVFGADLTDDNLFKIDFMSPKTQQKYLGKEVVVRLVHRSFSTLDDYWPVTWAAPILIPPGVYNAQITLIEDFNRMSAWDFKIDSPQNLSAHKRILSYHLQADDLKKFASKVLQRSFILTKVDKRDLQDKYIRIVVEHQLKFGQKEAYIKEIKRLI